MTDTYYRLVVRMPGTPAGKDDINFYLKDKRAADQAAEEARVLGARVGVLPCPAPIFSSLDDVREFLRAFGGKGTV